MLQYRRCVHHIRNRELPLITIRNFLASSYVSRQQRRPVSYQKQKPPSPTKKIIKLFDRREVPAYPYGPARLFKQSNRALFGGARPQFGNNVSGKFNIKTRRKWGLNTQRIQLHSKVLNRGIRVRLTTRVLRTIDKVGGLDEYLLCCKMSRIKDLGPRGWALRWRLMQEPSVKERFRLERQRRGWGEYEEGTRIDVSEQKPPQELAIMDLKKIVVDERKQRLMGTEPSRWRLLHLLFMNRLREKAEREQRLEMVTTDHNVASLVKSSATAATNTIVDRSFVTNDDATRSEISRFDEALDEEDRDPDLPDEDFENAPFAGRSDPNSLLKLQQQTSVPFQQQSA